MVHRQVFPKELAVFLRIPYGTTSFTAVTQMKHLRFVGHVSRLWVLNPVMVDGFIK